MEPCDAIFEMPSRLVRRALVREHFPDLFARMAALSRELDVRLARINDVRVFIDEIPADWATTDAIVPSCDFLCALAEMGLVDSGKD